MLEKAKEVVLAISLEKLEDGSQRIAYTEGSNIREVESMLVAACRVIERKVILEDLREELLKHMPKPTGLIKPNGLPVLKNTKN